MLKLKLTSGIGAPGKSAYEIAVENGFSGTEAEWLASFGSAPEWDTLTGKPTTLAGYGIETAVQDEITAQIAAQVATAADGLTGLDTLAEIIGAVKALQDPILQMFNYRPGVVARPSPQTCFTDLAGTTPAAVGDDVAYIANEIDANNPGLWATEGERPPLRLDGSGHYYLEMGDATRMATFLPLDAVNGEFGAIMVASLDDAASSNQGALAVRKSGTTSFARYNRTGTSDSLTGGTVYIDDGLIDLEAGTTTRGELFTDLQGLHVLSGIERDTIVTEVDWTFYEFNNAATIDGKFYGGIAAVDMIEAERVAAVAALMTDYDI